MYREKVRRGCGALELAIILFVGAGVPDGPFDNVTNLPKTS